MEPRPLFHVIDVSLKKQKMSQFTNYCKKTLAETKGLLNEYSSSADKDVLSNTTSKSVLPVIFALSSFLFVDIHLSVDIYSSENFSPVNALSHDINKSLKECLTTMLRDPEKTTSVLRTKQSSCTSFISFKRSIAHCINRYTMKAFLASPGFGLDFGSAPTNDISRNDGPFCDQGLTEMLEAKNIYNAEKVSLLWVPLNMRTLKMKILMPLVLMHLI